jgi:hypothetical protein
MPSAMRAEIRVSRTAMNVTVTALVKSSVVSIPACSGQ